MSQKKISPSNVTLLGWQQEVIDAIEKHESIRESEPYQGLPEYTVNKHLSVYVRFPRGSGHTFLANFIAHKYPCVVVYGKMSHYRQLTDFFPLHAATETVSQYEIFYAIFKPSNIQPSPDFMEVRQKFVGKKVVIVDNASSLSQDLQDFIYNNSEGIVVFLGH